MFLINCFYKSSEYIFRNFHEQSFVQKVLRKFISKKKKITEIKIILNTNITTKNFNRKKKTHPRNYFLQIFKDQEIFLHENKEFYRIVYPLNFYRYTFEK